MADKAFITPTALGQYFNEIYNETIAQLQNSKAKLVDDITKQLEVNYQKQIENLSLNLANIQSSSEREVSLLNQQLQLSQEEKMVQTTKIQQLTSELKKKGKLSVYIILLIVAALIIGWLIGRFIMSSTGS